MASFTPEQQPLEPQNTDWFSRGIHADQASGLGGLFDSLAKTLNTGVQVADQSEQRKITEDIQNQASAIQDQFDNTMITALGWNPDQPGLGVRTGQSNQDVPPGLQSGQQSIQSLQAAKMAGKLPDLYYWTKLNVMTRQLKTQYPGYADKIDGMVAGTVGSVPANRVQSELANAWATANSNAGSDPYSKLVDWAAKNGQLPPDFYQKQQQGDPYTFEHLQSYVATNTRQKAQVDAQLANLNLADKSNSLDDKTATQQWGVAANQHILNMIHNTGSLVGQDWNNLSTKLANFDEELKNGKTPSDQEIGQLKYVMNEMMTQANLSLNTLFNQHWDPNDPNPTNSFAGHVSADDDKKIRAQALAPLQTMLQALNDGNVGLLQAVSSSITAQENDATADVIKSLPWMAKLSAVNKLGGQAATSAFLASPKSQSALVTSISDFMNASIIGGDPNDNLSKDLATADKAGVGADVTKNVIDKWQASAKAISDNSLPIKLIQNHIHYLFSTDPSQTLGQMDSKSAQIFFQQIASPQVTQNMLKLKKSGDTEDWNTYVDWVRGAFVYNFRTDVQTLESDNQANLVSSDNTFNIKYDDTSNRFVNTGASSQAPNWFGINTPQGRIENINKNLAVIVPILKDAGLDTRKELSTLIQQMGFTGKRSGLADGLLNALTEMAKGGTTGSEAITPRL